MEYTNTTPVTEKSKDASHQNGNEEEDCSVASASSELPTMDDFLLVKPISKGAFGKVWLGYKKTNPGKMLAIKIMKKFDVVNKNLMSQVVAERDAQAMSRSPFVVQLYYSIQSKQNIFLIMEYMIGGDIKSLLIMYGYFADGMAKMYVAEVVLALEYLHERGIIHRDLKPDNMLISESGHIKLSDFGLSKVNVDVRNSPAPGTGSPFCHTRTHGLDLRTPGQILSLKSSLGFSVQNYKNSMRVKESDPDWNVTTACPDHQQQQQQQQSMGMCSSPTPSCPPLTPSDAKMIGNRRSVLCRAMTPLEKKKHFLSSLKPGDNRSDMSTPPIQSLTPTLQDSLTWRNSTASDSRSRQAVSLLHSSLLSASLRGGDLKDKGGSGGPSRMSVSESMMMDCSCSVSCCDSPMPGVVFAAAAHHCKAVTGDDDGGIAAAEGDGITNTTTFTKSKGGASLHPVANTIQLSRSGEGSQLCQKVECHSHVLPFLRQQRNTTEDSTPLLHLTSESVSNSYSAQCLRSMRDGSYCDADESSSKTDYCSCAEDNSMMTTTNSCGGNSSSSSIFMTGGKSLLAQPPGSNSSSSSLFRAMHYNKLSAIKGGLSLDMSQSSDSLKDDNYGKTSFNSTTGKSDNADDVFLSAGSDIVVKQNYSSSMEQARCVLSTGEDTTRESLMHPHSQIHSVANSTDLDLSSDFSSHFHRKPLLNSTRMSIFFGQSSSVSLDSGPEIKDLSQLSGLTRLPLKSLKVASNNSSSTDSIVNDKELQTSERSAKSKVSGKLRRQSSDRPDHCGRALERKLSKPSLRRVLSDTFDKCLPDRRPKMFDGSRSRASSAKLSDSSRSPSRTNPKYSDISSSSRHGNDAENELLMTSKLSSSPSNSKKEVTRHRKRSFQHAILESAITTTTTSSPPTGNGGGNLTAIKSRTGLTPDLLQLHLDRDGDDDISQPAKQPRLDRVLYSKNLFMPLSSSPLLLSSIESPTGSTNSSGLRRVAAAAAAAATPNVLREEQEEDPVVDYKFVGEMSNFRSGLTCEVKALALSDNTAAPTGHNTVDNNNSNSSEAANRQRGNVVHAESDSDLLLADAEDGGDSDSSCGSSSSSSGTNTNTEVNNKAKKRLESVPAAPAHPHLQQGCSGSYENLLRADDGPMDIADCISPVKYFHEGDGSHHHHHTDPSSSSSSTTTSSNVHHYRRQDSGDGKETMPFSIIPSSKSNHMLFSSPTPGTLPPDPTLPVHHSHATSSFPSTTPTTTIVAITSASTISSSSSSSAATSLLKPLLMIKGVSTLNSSMESDGCPNTTIETEANTSLTSQAAMMHSFGHSSSGDTSLNRSRHSSSDSNPGSASKDIMNIPRKKSIRSRRKSCPSNLPSFSCSPSGGTNREDDDSKTCTCKLSPEGSKFRQSSPGGGEDDGDGGECQTCLNGSGSKKVSASKKRQMPSIKEGEALGIGADSAAVFAKPLAVVTNNEKKTGSKCQKNQLDVDKPTDMISPTLGRKVLQPCSETPKTLCRYGGQDPQIGMRTPFQTPGFKGLQTPLRTPKSVRRGRNNDVAAAASECEERILGTPDYLAPEILQQKKHGFAVDWWALGVCLYEFLTGYPPFNDTTPEAVFNNILKRNISWPEEEEALSDQAVQAIEELLTVDPNKRPQSKGVKKMPFFSDLDWSNVMSMEPDFVPQPDDCMDTTYFEPKNAEMNILMSAVDL